jgi:hypothetical protein
MGFFERLSNARQNMVKRLVSETSEKLSVFAASRTSVEERFADGIDEAVIWFMSIYSFTDQVVSKFIVLRSIILSRTLSEVRTTFLKSGKINLIRLAPILDTVGASSHPMPLEPVELGWRADFENAIGLSSCRLKTCLEIRYNTVTSWLQ